MSNIVTKARKIQDKIKYNRSIKKELNEKRYRLFLQNPNRSLPPLKKLVKWRLELILVGFFFFLIPSIQVLFFYDTLFYSGPKSLYFYSDNQNLMGFLLEYLATFCGSCGMIIWSLAATIDFAIYRRFKKGYFIEWKGYKKTSN